ncbi:MAG TPA: type II secretion system F family protein [Isosphaeraceae bacterium]|nr:type II secretion system F family protein [Isosphaeraceae bacterium]
MPRYRYSATSAQGNRVSGEVDSDSPERAMAHLAAGGLKVERLELVEPAQTVSRQDAADFARHVARLSDAGLPLPEGLKALGSELATGSMRKVVNAVARDLEAGMSLDSAIESHGNRFPAHLKHLVHAGLRSGALGELLEQYARYQHLGAALTRKIKLSMVYPVMLTVALGMLLIFVSNVVMNFEHIYADFGMSLPGITLFLITAARPLARIGTWGLTVLLTGLVLVWRVGLQVGVRGQGRSLFGRLPLVGPLLRWLSLVEFTHLLALLLECETPLPEALSLSGEGLRDPNLAWSCRFLRQEVEQGHSLATAMVHARGFPMGLARIVAWAQESHSLPDALHLAGDMYEARARAQATFVGVTCTVLAIALVIWGVGIAVIGLFLPMIQLISRLAG